MKNIFEHDNIFLRPLETDDLEKLYEWENDSENWLVSNTLTPFSKYTLAKFIETSSQDIFESKQQRFMIVLKENNEAIGAIDIFDFDPFHLRAGIGILIGDKRFRKKGLAREALDVIISYAGKTLLLKQLYCNISEDNEDSLKLFIEKSFVITGQKRDWIKTGKGWLTEYFLQLQLF
jgi:diamine N-acetyltransferase